MKYTFGVFLSLCGNVMILHNYQISILQKKWSVSPFLLTVGFVCNGAKCVAFSNYPKAHELMSRNDGDYISAHICNSEIIICKSQSKINVV